MTQEEYQEKLTDIVRRAFDLDRELQALYSTAPRPAKPDRQPFRTRVRVTWLNDEGEPAKDRELQLLRTKPRPLSYKEALARKNPGRPGGRPGALLWYARKTMRRLHNYPIKPTELVRAMIEGELHVYAAGIWNFDKVWRAINPSLYANKKIWRRFKEGTICLTKHGMKMDGD